MSSDPLLEADTPFFRRHLRGLGIAVAIIILLNLLLMFYWDSEPDSFDVRQVAIEQNGGEANLVTGAVTTAALIHVAGTMLDKPGGYLSNDVMPPGVIMDNIPNWEYGVITQVRDLARALRNDFSRSQTQSTEDQDLVLADPDFHIDTESWMFPASENKYRQAIESVRRYQQRLRDEGESEAQFFSRADNLRDWLAIVEKRLGSLSQRLSASVGQVRINIDLEGDAEAVQSTVKPEQVIVTTPWLEIDDVFYEARGSTWALLHFLKAMEYDLREVLEKKNARVSMKQIIRELETSQDTVWSPMILNGSGFGVLTNHSLIMASYVSRANAAVIDLRNLLEQG